MKSVTNEDRNKVLELFSDSCLYMSMKSGSKPAHLFYTHFLQALRYKETDIVPLAGVAFSPEAPVGTFFVNPLNAKNLTLDQFSGLVIHEVCHLLFSHTYAEELKDSSIRRLVNIAMDMEINQIVLRDGYSLPRGKGILTNDPEDDIYPMLPETVANDLGVAVPEPNKDWKYYLNWLLEHSESQELEDQSQHEHWEDDELSPEAKQLVERMIQEAAKEAQQYAGGLPSSVEACVTQLVKKLEAKPDWTKHLAESFGMCGNSALYIKRRFNKHDLLGLASFAPKLALGVVLDTSGSVTDKDYGRMLGECLHLSQARGIEVIVQETSYDNTKSMWKLSEVGVKEFYERNGYGGTNMKPGVEAFLREWDEESEYRVGAIVVMSDGDLGTNSIVTPEECHLPLLWLFTGPAEPFKGHRVAGKVIHI